MSILINGSDSPRVTAWNIYNQLGLGQSIDIHGWAINEFHEQLKPLGDLVFEQIKHWDEVQNITYYGKKKQRKFVYPVKTVGGPLAHKIFKYNKVMIDNLPRVTIYRIQ